LIVSHTGIKEHLGNFHKPFMEGWLWGDKDYKNLQRKNRFL